MGHFKRNRGPPGSKKGRQGTEIQIHEEWLYIPTYLSSNSLICPQKNFRGLQVKKKGTELRGLIQESLQGLSKTKREYFRSSNGSIYKYLSQEPAASVREEGNSVLAAMEDIYESNNKRWGYLRNCLLS